MAHHSSKMVIYAAFAGNAAISLTKFFAAFVTGSSAMMSEAIHSVVDSGNQLLLLYGMKRASLPATPDHPFGHGLQLYFYTFVVAVLIFGVGAVISILSGIQKIMHPATVEHAEINYIVLTASIAFEAIVWVLALKAFNSSRGKLSILQAVRRSKDPTLFTVLFEDTAALLGLIVALCGVFFSQLLDMPVLDGLASVIIGVILALTAGFLAYESQSLLTGESADPATRDGIAEIARNEPGVERLNQNLTMHFGPNDVFVALSLDFRDSLTAAEVENTVSKIEQTIKATFPHVSRVFIEAQNFEAHRQSRLKEEVREGV